MLVIGLTGNLGSGKSTVAAMFKQQGAKIIDADAITRGLLAPGQKSVKKVANIFPGVILKNRSIDRKALAKIVFNHPRELQKLTDILYPEALKEVKKLISLYKKHPFVILDAPLLFESGWDKFTDTSVVVTATRQQQLERAQKRLGLTRAQALRRLRHQMPLKKKCGMADMIIDNSHGLARTRRQVDEIMDRLKRKKF